MDKSLNRVLGVYKIILGLTVLAGIFYVIIQWFYTDEVIDSLFVGLLLGASVLLVIGVNWLAGYINHHSLPFFISVNDSKSLSTAEFLRKSLIDEVFAKRNTIGSGVLYGIVVSSAPILYGSWQDLPLLTISLSIFLLMANTLTGMALYGLGKFVIYLNSIIPNIHIDLWQANSGKTDFLLGTTRKLTLIASAYISLSITSILFSVFVIDALVISYVGFCGIVLLIVLFWVPAPIVKKLNSAKIDALAELDTRIQLLFSTPDGKSLDDSESLGKIKNLLDLREKIEAMNTWPFKVKSILAGLSVIFFSTLPGIIQLLLNTIFG